MTLFKQMALMLSVFLYTILTIVLFLNFQSTKNSVKDRLYDDAKNTATSLSLSLGSVNGDVTAMSTMINANFDSGNYNKIRLVDIDTNVLYERKNETDDRTVPNWFLNLINIKAPIAFANVSAGWSQVGVLEVVGDATYAHKQLYSTFVDLLILFTTVIVVGLLILNYLIHIMLKPLKDIQQQAAAISRNEFIIQENTPYIIEFRDVVVGMNNMVVKVKAMFDKGNRELSFFKEQEYIDRETSLRNKKYFIDKLLEYLKVDASYAGGVNVLLFINGVVEANDKIGRVNVNKMFIEFVDIFKQYTQSIDESIVIRMGGVEFSLFLPNSKIDDIIGIVHSIQNKSYNIIQNYKLDTNKVYLAFGLYEYSSKNSVTQFLSACDDTLSQAKFFENRIFAQKAKESFEIMGRDEWRQTIQKSIDENKFEFIFWNVLDTKNKTELHKIISVKLNYNDKKSFSYAQFMSHAIQAGLSFNLYQILLKNIFMSSGILNNNTSYSFRLPKEFLEHKDAYEYLQGLLKSTKRKYNITIELPDRLLRDDSKHIRDIVELFKKHNIEVGIFEFIGESNDYEYIQHLRPVYIKAQASYLLSQSKESLNALRLITDTVGISLIAVGVDDIEEVHKLESLDIFNIQGSVTLSIN